MDHGEPHSVTDPPHDSSPSSRHSGQSSIPDEDYASVSNIGADHLRGAGQYRAPQMTDITGKKEIHFHYYMNERPPEKTINITAENVIIGENALYKCTRFLHLSRDTLVPASEPKKCSVYWWPVRYFGISE
jgi:hypothetical protein